MKKVVFTLALVAMSIMTMAQQWVGINGNTPAAPQVKLISSSEAKVIVDFSLSGFSMTRVSTPNGLQQVISVPKMASMLEAGAPDLPHFPIPAIIGDAAEMEVNVISCLFKDYQDIEVAPSKGNFSRQIDPETVAYTYGPMYQKDAFYPTNQAYLETPYIYRDFRGQNIMVQPFAYNPATKTLRVYTNLTIEMKKVSDNGVNQKMSRKAIQKMSPEMKKAYSHRFINYMETGAKYEFVTDRGEMLVISPDQYVEAMQPFVDWKNQSGRPTTIVSLSEVGGNNDNQIKNYINELYTNPERNLEYVLLVGDYGDLTPHSMSGGRSDNWFGQLEGNDNYLEVLTGRFSVQSLSDVATHIEKVLYYERDMPEGLTWVNQGIGIGANEGAGQGHNGGEADYVHINYIRDTLMHYTYENVTQQYSGVGSGTNANAISADFNEGKSICNYCNHGSQTSWAVAGYSNSHVNALVNDDKWPYIWSVACNNGEFNGNCFGEAWLRATNNTTGRPTGAVGGMFSWISQPWVPPMTGQDEMVNILTEWKHNDQYCHTFGGASLNGSMYILDMHPSDQGATHNTWILFGDPSLMVRTDNPVSMNLSLSPAALMLGMSTLEISAENTAYGIATLMMNGEIIASSEIHDGTATLNFSPLSDVGTATLTVIGYNKVTEVIPVEILPAEGAYLTVSSFTPNFAPVNVETSLTMSFKNVGVDPTEGTTTVTLSCDDQRMVILNGTSQLDVVAADDIVTLQDAFSFTIAEGVEDGERFQIDVTMECGNQTWIGKAIITAGQAIINYANAIWPGSYIPGEDLFIVANFQNIGHYMATNAIATISCESEYVTLFNESVEFGTIDPEGIASCVFHLSIDPSCPTTEQIPLNFTMHADGDLNVEGSLVLKNTCNVIFDLVDSYGDGWNGNQLVVSFSDGTPTQNLTISSGASASYTLEIGRGVHVTLGWINGQYSYECSFTVKYENGDQIYSGGAGVNFEFDCNCTGDSPIGNFNPVENLTADVEIGAVILTWDAPVGAVSYTIYRNGIEIGQALESSYTDVVASEIHFTYCIVANYEDGSSLPECIDVKAEMSLDENETEFVIYPNPANSTLCINCGNAEYSYTMYNGMGQVVANGNAQGTEQISVNNMTKGVYFLRLTSGTQVRVEKVVVK